MSGERRLKLSSKSVQGVIDERIVPLVSVDGGQIELVAVNDADRRVTIRFGGSYRGNPCRGVVADFVVTPILKTALNAPLTVEVVD